jgi:hypothetical protein
MKLMLAHVVMNYDVRIDGKRPKNFDLKSHSVPHPRTKLQVRLRER